jgi:hypothetical protein
MAVKVTVARSSNGSSIKDETHDGGGDFKVSDGHLFITDTRFSDSNKIAAYAPGQWLSVEVTS